MRSKQGQGLSLTVIIVAALALIVLVVLIMVFTGRIAIFSEGVSQAGQAELVKMRINYGQCQPSATMEGNFMTSFSSAESLEEEATARADFRDLVDSCKGLNEKAVCESEGTCRWS